MTESWLELQDPGVYQIPFACGKVYVGQTGQTIVLREQKHKCHLRLGNIDKPAIAYHGWQTGHKILRTLLSFIDPEIGMIE